MARYRIDILYTWIPDTALSMRWTENPQITAD